MPELFDVLDESGGFTGERRTREEVHSLGLWHRAVHTWMFCPCTREVLLQMRASCKDSWPDRWDISSAGHLSAGDASLPSAVRELNEELGLAFAPARFEFLWTLREEIESVQHGRPFKNYEFNDVYVLTLTAEERRELESPAAFRLQAEEVSAVRFFSIADVARMYSSGDPAIVPCGDWVKYSRLFGELERRCA